MHSVVHTAMMVILLLLLQGFLFHFLKLLLFFLGNMMDVIGLVMLIYIFQRAPNRLIVSVLSVVRVPA